MMNSLQSDYPGLVVKVQFDNDAANLFKSLEKSTNQFKGDS